MYPLPVVPHLDVFENSLYGLLSRFELFQVDELSLDDAVKGLDARVSGPEESHPEALSEPDLNLSAHPAPIIQPN